MSADRLDRRRAVTTLPAYFDPTNRKSVRERLRVRFFGKIQIRILVSKNGFCVSLPKSENGLITD